MQNEGVWFLGDSVQLSRTSHRNPPATGLRPAALPPLARGAFGAEWFVSVPKAPLLKGAGTAAGGDWGIPVYLSVFL